MASGKNKTRDLEKLSFEECLEHLDTLVREMESGEIPLEEMISKFEEGSAIASVCHKKLSSLKQKIEMLQTSRKSPEDETPAPETAEISGELFSDEPF